MTTQPEALRLADELVSPLGTQSTYSAMQEASAELRRLHAAEADFYMAYRMQCDEQTKALHAEVEALRADAERYRWLREHSTEYGLTQKDGYGGSELLGWEELDAAIDAARSKT